MRQFVYIFLFLMAGLGAHSAQAQAVLAQANQEFEKLAYAKAAELYEKALKASPKDSSKREVLTRLAYSYRQVRDTQNAERVYRLLTASGATATDYLYLAQAMASNGKYEEAKDVYEKYSKAQTEDQRGVTFAKAYSNVGKLSKNASSYTVEFLDINTNRAEFSPMFYKKGLMFVSARNEGVNVKRVFGWNQTPFLDLYELPDLSAIGSTKTSKLGGSAKPTATKVKPGSYNVGNDFYTEPTSNDSKITGNYAGGNGKVTEPLQEAPIGSKNVGKSLNSKYHEGPVTFFKDGKRILFTRNNYSNGKYAQSKEGINKLKLYSAEIVGEDWKNIEELPFNSNEYSTGHPSLSKDEKLLYFVSDMPGGIGGTDIYVAKYESGKWSAPLNLGPSVNTKGNEMFPFVDDKGDLYFSSDGHPGLGDLDVFYVKLIDGVMAKKAQNLGAPINSAKDDFGLITDAERKSGFLSSNRRRGGADDDIYRFERQGPLNPCQDLIVNVYDEETKAPLANATVELSNKSDSEVQPKNLTTDAEGNLRLCLDAENDFLFKASTEGYLNNNVNFTTKDLDGSEPVRLEIPLDKLKPKIKTFTLRGSVLTQKDKKPIPGVKVILRNECDSTIQESTTGADGAYQFEVPTGCDYTIEALKDNFGTMGNKVAKLETDSEANITMFEKGDIIKVENIYYDLNKWNIRPDAATELDKLVELMNKYPKMKFEFRSHTDSRSSAKYNKNLSTKRAKAAVAYLVKKGISAKRVVAAGYGESLLVNGCKDGVNCAEEEHQQNRRTEIKILSL
jgi:outer membrane protein OmpA-like peptidoglycan-associated protein/tetratricopeptide (TPR) repeat protein